MVDVVVRLWYMVKNIYFIKAKWYVCVCVGGGRGGREGGHTIGNNTMILRAVWNPPSKC